MKERVNHSIVLKLLHSMSMYFLLIQNNNNEFKFELIHWGQDKMADISQMILFKCIIFDLDSNFTQICSWETNLQ